MQRAYRQSITRDASPTLKRMLFVLGGALVCLPACGAATQPAAQPTPTAGAPTGNDPAVAPKGKDDPAGGAAATKPAVATNTSPDVHAAKSPDVVIDAPDADALGEPGINVMYLPSGDPTLDLWMSTLRSIKFMEHLTLLIDARIVLPRSLPVKVAKCGFVNAYYHRTKHEVVLCHEQVAHFARLFAKDKGLDSSNPAHRKTILRQVIMTSIFLMYHELGHALIGELDLPVTGRMEDVADQAAAWILLSLNTKGKLAESVLAGAEWFATEAKNSAHIKKGYSGAHSLDEQRYFNLMCWAYGANPKRFGPLTQKLPKHRKRRCKREFDQLNRAFTLLLKPHTRSPEQQRKRTVLLTQLIDDKVPPSADSKACSKAAVHGTQVSIVAHLAKLQRAGKIPDDAAARKKLKKSLIAGMKGAARRGVVMCLTKPWSKTRIACTIKAKDRPALMACSKM